MDGLRKALAEYALLYANQKMCPTEEGALNAFKQIGRAYIKIALEEPDLFQFVFLNGSGCYPTGNSQMLVEDENNAQLIQQIADEFQVSEQKAGEFLQNTLIYTHGLAAIVATGVMCLSEEMMKLIDRVGNYFFMKAGIPADKKYDHDEGYCDE